MVTSRALFHSFQMNANSYLFGVYLHDLVAHAPLQYEMVCLWFMVHKCRKESQAKHISLKASNRKPMSYLPAYRLENGGYAPVCTEA